MSKYDALGTYLSKQVGSEIPMTFAEVERVIGTSLPPKAQHYPAWWSNNTSNNVMTRVWLDAGFKTEQVSIPSRKLVFKRQSGSPALSTSASGRNPGPSIGGFGEASASGFGGPAGKMAGHHPLIGSMAGTFTIEPGFDLTGPSLDADELRNLEANIDETADLIERGGARKR